MNIQARLVAGENLGLPLTTSATTRFVVIELGTSGLRISLSESAALALANDLADAAEEVRGHRLRRADSAARKAEGAA